MSLSRFYLLIFVIFYSVTLFSVPNSAFARKAFTISDEQSSLLHQSFLLAQSSDYDKALSIISKANSPVLTKILLWHYYLNGTDISFEDITDFIRQSPDWPRRSALLKNAERSIRFSDSPKRIISWLSQHPPETAYGKWLLANAYIKQSWYLPSDPSIVSLIREAWIYGNFSKNEEKAFLNQYKKLLLHGDHVARIDRLLWNERVRQSKRSLHLVSKDYRKLFTARIYLIRNRLGVDKAIKSVPAALKQNIGLAFDRLRWRQRKKRYDEARELLIHMPIPPIYADKFWPILSRHTRMLIRQNDYHAAYQLISRHQQTDTQFYAEAEWLAGWLALRKLRQPDKALTHFTNLYNSVAFPISVSRASYWLGRTYVAKNNTRSARKWFKEASTYSTTFYGQLAFEALAANKYSRLPSIPYISNADFNQSNYNPLLHAAYYWQHLDEKEYAHAFIRASVRQAPTHGQLALATRFSLTHLNRPDLAIKAASVALRRGIFISDALYPSLDLSTTDLPLDTSLILSVIRQESHFHASVRSSSGAVGLMQLMPSTARVTSRRLHQRYSSRRLERDPYYNILLGSNYLNTLLRRHKHALVPSLASYNAGPGNVRKWYDSYGNYSTLRTLEERIDWIESIPFPETRNYVQRVIESRNVYRALLQHDSHLYSGDIALVLMHKQPINASH